MLNAGRCDWSAVETGERGLCVAAGGNGGLGGGYGGLGGDGGLGGGDSGGFGGGEGKQIHCELITLLSSVSTELQPARHYLCCLVCNM